jgi:hypothetical protein
MSISTIADRSEVIGMSIADYCDVAGLPVVLQTSWKITEPDLGLIKQGEQVTTFSWAGACQDSEHRDQRRGGGSSIFNLLFGFADVWLQKTAKTANSG